MTKDEIIKKLRDMAKYPTVTIPRDSVALKEAADLLAQPERDYERGFIDGMQKQMQSSVDKAVNRMAQPEQEPVIDKSAAVRIATALGWEPKRKPLTDEEIILIVADCASSYQHTDIHFARAIEAAHGIKELEMNFVKWFRSEPHRDKYESDHPAFLAAREAWDASRKEALAQSEQEPVAWMDGYRNIYSLEEKAAGCEDAVIPLVPATLQHWSDCSVHNEPAYPSGKCDCGGYTTPPHRKPLTDEQKVALCKQFPDHLTFNAIHAIEATHGIKE